MYIDDEILVAEHQYGPFNNHFVVLVDALRPSRQIFRHVGTFSLVELVLMPSLHLAYDELTGIVRCLNSHFRTIIVRYRTFLDLRTEIVRYRTFLGRRRVVVASTILFNSELYKKIKIVET